MLLLTKFPFCFFSPGSFVKLSIFRCLGFLEGEGVINGIVYFREGQV